MGPVEVAAADVGEEVADPEVVAGVVEVHEDAVGEARQGDKNMFRFVCYVSVPSTKREIFCKCDCLYYCRLDLRRGHGQTSKSVCKNVLFFLR